MSEKTKPEYKAVYCEVCNGFDPSGHHIYNKMPLCRACLPKVRTYRAARRALLPPKPERIVIKKKKVAAK